jgi:hypothetical protein
VKWGRWWLALSYVLATLLAQGVHDHDWRADASVLESKGDCDDTRPHVAEHQVDGSLATSIDCPSCHFRGQYSLSELAPRPLPGPGIAIPPTTAAVSTLPGSPFRTRCRAPPSRLT